MGKLLAFQPSRTSSIRSSLIFGLSLCAMARAESRMGSVERAEHLLEKARRAVASASGDLDREARLSPAERHHLTRMVDQLNTSIGGLDPLWIADARRRVKKDTPLPVRIPLQQKLAN